MVDISKRIQSLENETQSLKSQVAEAKMTFKSLFPMNEEPLKLVIKDAMDENSQLQESQKQLLQEAEKITLEDSKVHAEQVLSDKDNHIKTLTEHLLKMKDWAAMLGEDTRDEDNVESEMNSESENGAYLDHSPNGALKKLIHAATFNASFKSLEGEIDKTKEELTERIKNLETELASLPSENTF
ncbi:Melanoma inhibitory activity protein 2 [Plecturocebus cupreus]